MPVVWFATRVGDGDDRNAILVDAIYQLVGVSAHKIVPMPIIVHRKSGWVLADRAKRCVKLGFKASSDAHASFSVPTKRLREFPLCRRCKNDVNHRGQLLDGPSLELHSMAPS